LFAKVLFADLDDERARKDFDRQIQGGSDMFSIDLFGWFMAYFVCAVLAGFAAGRIWRGWIKEDPVRDGAPQVGAFFATFLLLAFVGWWPLTIVPSGGVALRGDGTVFVNPSYTVSRVLLGHAKAFGVGWVRVGMAYTTMSGNNFRRLAYRVDVNLPSESLPAVARLEWSSRYTLEETVKGLLWQLQDERSREFEGFNNPADPEQQRRFARMVSEYLGSRLPETLAVRSGPFYLEDPLVCYR
jgi:hypothetical protein